MTRQDAKPMDHRTRVAQERRDRMRERLLSAVMSVYAHRGQHAAPVIDDVIREAGVARGTFYKYFTSLDEAVDVLGHELSDEMTHGLAELYASVADPLLRIGTGSQLFLLRGVIDPAWGAFVSRTDYFARDSYFLQMITADVQAAQAVGLAENREVESVVDLLLGSTMTSIRRLSQVANPRRKYVEDVAALLLCGLGVDATRANEVVRDRAIYIRGLAPDHLAWWKDPWAPA